MFKVLIADDEVKVCRLISCLIDWEALGLKLVGMVHDGLSAYRFIEEHNPDIVITDIKMPRYDGLELIRNVKKYRENIHFIIISGYSDFSYAQKAIKYGVEDYLLKPIKKKELEQALNKLIFAQRQAESNRKEKEIMHRQITHTTQKMKSTLLKELLESPEEFRKYSGIDEINHIYCSRLTNGYFQTAIFQMNMKSRETDAHIADFLTEKVKTVVTGELSSFHEVLTIRTGGKIYCLINGSMDEFGNINRIFKKIRLKLLALQDVFGELLLTIAVSSIKASFNDVFACLDESGYAVLNRVISPPNSIIEFTSDCLPVGQTDELLNNTFRKRFLINIETFNFADQAEALSELQAALKERKNLNGAYVLQMHKDLTELFHFGLKSCGIEQKQVSCQEEAAIEFNSFHSIDDIFTHLLNRMQDILLEWKKEKKFESSKPIRTAKQYINKNYAEPLTLDIIGDYIGLNPSYFSSIFKKEEGISFVDYLTEIRIEAARQQLVETGDSILVISENSGFNDMKYFNKKFKQLTGLSPTDYRKLYS